MNNASVNVFKDIPIIDVKSDRQILVKIAGL